MALLRNIKEKSYPYLLSKLLMLHKKPRNCMQIEFLNHLMRRNCCSENKLQRKKFFSLEHKKYLHFFQRKKFRVNADFVSILTKIYETDDDRFVKLALRPEHLERCSITDLEDRALYLRELNFTAEHIISSPWILLLTKDNIEAKIPLIEESYLFESIQDGLGFCLFNLELIISYCKKFESEISEFHPFRNRIYYIGERLNIPINILTLKLVPAWEVLRLKRARIDKVLELLSEFNYKPVDVLDDIRVFHSDCNLAKERLLELQKIGVYQPKFWIWRGTDYGYVRFYNQNKKYGINSGDHVKLLMEELNLSEEECLDLFLRKKLHVLTPRLIRYKIRTYKDAGFANNIILKHPKILTYSEDKIIRRVNFLKEKGIFDPTELDFILSEKKYFDKRVIKLVKRLNFLKENGLFEETGLDCIFRTNKIFNKQIKHLLRDKKRAS